MGAFFKGIDDGIKVLKDRLGLVILIDQDQASTGELIDVVLVPTVTKLEGERT
jgi:hypothetical protein